MTVYQQSDYRRMRGRVRWAVIINVTSGLANILLGLITVD